MPLAADVGLAIKANVAVIATLQSQIELLEKRLQECVKPQPQYGLLTSVPGIGQALATVIHLETGPIDRFADVGNFASYARCVDSVHTSNRKKKGEGNVKNGNKYLAWAFVEAANFAVRFCPEAKRFHERKKAKTNNIVATKALAHKLARACYHILKEEPRTVTGVATSCTELDAGSPSPAAVTADRPHRKPSGDWRRHAGNHGSVKFFWMRGGTNILLGRPCRQGAGSGWADA